MKENRLTDESASDISFFEKMGFIFVTVYYLKPTQIFFRILRKLQSFVFFAPVNDITEIGYPSRDYISKWTHCALYEKKVEKEISVSFLNVRKQLELPGDWNNPALGRLWLYNLHYFEHLVSYEVPADIPSSSQLIDRWVAENPVGFGVGWEPYPTSLRIVNWIKAWLAGLHINKASLNNLYLQAAFLEKRQEKHLLGNHYFSNLKALLFAGVLFNNSRWITKAEEGLLSEIPEQILEDGGNFELSPMYHSLMLVDMLDLFNLTRAYPDRLSSQLIFVLQQFIPKMLSFMEAVSHTDGSVSFFNDSAIGIAPTKLKIESYAEQLGFAVELLDCSKPQIIDNSQSGYFCAITGPNKLIFDASPVGPDYIPGHGHADTLSFELSIGAQRVFVNSGTSEYGLSVTRLNQRKTKSHNTVEVDGKDSSQVWSGFRVARRARIVSRSAELDDESRIILKGAHDGYKCFFSGCVHARTIVFSDGMLAITDSLQGVFKHAKSRFFLHPSLFVSFEDDILRIEGRSFILQSNLRGENASLVESDWYPEFGIKVPNKTLEVEFKNSQLEIVFEWEER